MAGQVLVCISILATHGPKGGGRAGHYGGFGNFGVYCVNGIGFDFVSRICVPLCCGLGFGCFGSFGCFGLGLVTEILKKIYRDRS